MDIPQYLLGIDIGTTSTKTIICDQNGNIVFSTSEKQNLYSEKPGWAEENPDEWWENTKATIKDCFNKTDVRPEEIAAVGVTGMVPALVLLDKEGRVLRKSIQQNDSRTINELEILKQILDEKEFFKITGGSINQQLIGPKIMWLKEYEPEVYQNIEKIMGSYDYINFKLTGEHTIEHNWALESGLLNLAQKSWQKNILDTCLIKEEWLGSIVSSDEVIGKVSKEVAEKTDLKEGTPVVGGIADHVSSAFAAGLKEEGDLNIKFGGAGDILYSLETLKTDRRLFIDYHADPVKYMINGCMAASGSLLKWFIKEFCQYEEKCTAGSDESVFEFLDVEAKKIPSGSGGVIVLPYFLGEKTPLHDPLARGVIYGLGLNHEKANIYRAIMEAVAYGFRHHMDVLNELDLEIKKVVATDGGARSELWRQITADVLGKPIQYIKNHPGSSLGAAFVAGKGIGVFDSWNEIDRFIEVESVTEPNMKNHKIYSQYYKLYRKIYRDLKESFVELNEIKNG